MAAGDGLISMKPTSIVHAGTSASINADGGVDFSAVTSLSLNGVFTGDYDNYLIVLTGTTNVSSNILYRLRVSGTDASAGNYTGQYLEASSGPGVGANRVSSQTEGRIGFYSSTLNNGFATAFYGPFLAQPTASRGVSAGGNNDAYMIEWAWTHSLSTSYDGITLYLASNNATGTVHVFGYEE